MKSFASIATFLSAFLATAIAVPLVQRDASSFTVCPGTTPSFTVSTLSYTPDPPVPGKSVDVHVTGTSSATLTQGSTLEVDGSVFGITVFTQTIDLCDQLQKKNNISCPVAPGPQDWILGFDVPSQAPSGTTVDLKIQATNSDKSSLLCLQGPITLG